jgi:hypothetical protein
MRNLLVQDIVLVRAGTSTNRYGTVEKDWSTATRVTVKGWVSRSSQSEDATRREAQISQWVGYFPESTDVVGGDRVEWDGVVFEVDGPPFRAWTPRGEHHVEAPLRVVEG